MEILPKILEMIMLGCAVLLCVFVGFFQTSRAGGLTGITGEGLALFEKTKVRGTEKTIQTIVTVLTAILFGCLVLIPLVSR